MLYVIIGTIVVFGVTLSLIYRHEPAKTKRFGLLVTFVLTLCATFVGVFLAFQLSNLEAEQSEKGVLESAIQLSTDELDREIRWLKQFASNYLEDPYSEKEAENMLNSNPIEAIYSLDGLLANPLFPRYCSSMGTGMILSFAKSKEKMRELANSSDTTLRSRLTALYIYIEYLEDLRTLLLTEVEYIRGKISDREVLLRLDALHHINIKTETLQE